MLAGGSICAERTALGKLQLMEYDDLVAVHIVTDAADPITPGTLCRQYMSEVGSASTRVVVDAAKGRIITTLGELYPCPYLYQGVPRHDVISYARTCAQHAQAPASVLEAPEVELLREVCGTTWLQRACSHVVLCCAVLCCVQLSLRVGGFRLWLRLGEMPRTRSTLFALVAVRCSATDPWRSRGKARPWSMAPPPGCSRNYCTASSRRLMPALKSSCLCRCVHGSRQLGASC